MATINAVNTTLSGQSGTGNFAGTISPLMVSPRITNGLYDVNNNLMIGFNPQASAVDYIIFNNAVAGGIVGIQAAGTDTDIQINLASKGVDPVVLASQGTTTPIQWITGTAYQHTTRWNLSNTSATRDVTLQDASGTLAFLADRGWVQLGTATASNSATLTFTNVTGYNNYMLVFNALTPATNTAILAMQGSTDNGSTWLGPAASYYQQSLFATNTAVAAGSDVTTLTFAVMTSNILNSVPGPSGWIMFQGLAQATRKGYTSQVSYVNSTTSTLGTLNAGGWFATSSVVNALRLVMTSGNITSGTVQLYGML